MEVNNSQTRRFVFLLYQPFQNIDHIHMIVLDNASKYSELHQNDQFYI